MSHSICLWILALGLSAAPDPNVYWDYAVMRLGYVDAVSEPPIPSGSPFHRFGLVCWEYVDTRQSEFFDLSQTMVRVGREEDFRKLLSDERAVVRCMGLLTLAQVKGTAAVPVIRSYLGDGGQIKYFLHADVVRAYAEEVEYDSGVGRGLFTTVGHFAWRLLLNANDLQPFGVPRPLLTDSERIGLEIELLAADSQMAARSYALAHLPMVIRHGTLVLQLDALQAHAPTLEDYQIIKGIGRLKPRVAQRDFLIACLQDRALDANARLAAGSALTRHTDDISLDALRNASLYFNRLDERRWGDQFLETVQTRRRHEIDVEPVQVELAWWRTPYDDPDHPVPRYGPLKEWEQDHRCLLAKRTWRTPDEIRDRLITACTCHHPLAMNDLLEGQTLCAYHDLPDVRRAAGNSLLEISRQLKDYSQPWSTYADTASLLAQCVAKERHRASVVRILTDAQCDEIEKNSAATKRDKQRPAAEKPPESVTAEDGGM